MQTLVFLYGPDFEALFLAFGQGLLDISAEVDLIIKEVVGLKLFIVIAYFIWFEQQRDVSEAAELGVLH